MTHLIRTVEALEAQVGPRPAAIDLKVIDHLDAQACRWLAAAPLAFAGFCDGRRMTVTMAGDAAGFATALDAGQLRLPRAAFDEPGFALPGHGAGLLFVVPGLGETLRVNGAVARADDASVVIEVQECYAHCAKALLRSDFWQPAADAPTDVDAFVQASRFMGLATADADGHADLSPKGDPAGALVRASDGRLHFADRPGNRRTDSLRNLLARPFAAALLLIPGHARVAVVQGEATLSADMQLRQAFTVQERIPRPVTSLAPTSIALRDSPALVRARLWSVPAVAPADLDPAMLFAAHVKLNKARGLRAAIAKGMVSVPGLMRAGLQQDYKRNLY